MPVIFIVIWSLLGLGGLSVFLGDQVSVSFKRRAWPAYIVLTSFLFLVFGFLMDRIQVGQLAIGIPLLSLITWLNISRTKFCSNCGRLNNSGLGASDRFCRRCGHSLTDLTLKPDSN